MLQVLTDFVKAINEDWLYKCKIAQGSCKLGDEIISSFASMPHTTSAVALWLAKLDDLIAPYIKGPCSERRQGTTIRGNGLEYKTSIISLKKERRHVCFSPLLVGKMIHATYKCIIL